MIVFCLLCWEGRWLYIAVTYTQGHCSFLFSLLKVPVFRMFYCLVKSFPRLNVCGSHFSCLDCILGSRLLIYERASQPLPPPPYHGPCPSSNKRRCSCPPPAPRGECWHLEGPHVTTGGDTEVQQAPPPRWSP